MTQALLHGSWTGLHERGSPHSMRPHGGLGCWDHRPERGRAMNFGGEGGQTGICGEALGQGALTGRSGSGRMVARPRLITS